ncbi:ABC transporter substrate-binding protein [Candidatus Enterococcus mangumiae]|uniref:Raffinose/stachyose/melibiose transport system substrate-binding protein n=2 Tax=Enterococcus TaxID=1350 RepID=A0ABZ2SZ26_9ENTE|nr:ABC transporter substrate-binding protein [Enterococcus sp. DIV1094]MBO0489312.1 carbohydrate ABC transporter substrate-binding protein [Enterococcus sp. DIV1094]
MKKQRGFLVLAFAMLLGIAGCGTTQSGRSDDGSVTLEIFNIKTETAEQMDALVEAFENDHPEIKINLTTVGGGTDATAALQSKFSSGDEPDIFMLGGLADTQIWQHKLYDLGETTLAKQAIEGTLEGATLDGTIYGVPMNIEGYGWLINQEIFKEAGIDNDSINTFEAFEEAVQLLDSKKEELGLQGVFGFSGAETWVSSQYSSNFFAPEFDDSLEKTYEAPELSVDYAEQMKNYTDLVIEYNAQPMEAMDYSTSVEELFASGKVAIIHQGNWIVPTLDSLDETFTKEKLGIIPMQIESPEESKIVAGPAWYWGVNKDKDQEIIDASIEFLTWMYTDEQAMTAIIDEFQFIPAYTNFSSEAIHDPLSKEIYTYLSEGQTVPWVHNSYPDGYGQNIFGVQIQAYAAGRISWEEFIDTLQTSWAQERE